jgi:hypothetical protein
LDPLWLYSLINLVRLQIVPVMICESRQHPDHLELVDRRDVGGCGQEVSFEVL